MEFSRQIPNKLAGRGYDIPQVRLSRSFPCCWLSTWLQSRKKATKDYIRHSVDDGTLYVTVFFNDKTAFSLRYACEMFAVEVALSDWKTGNMEMIREYMKSIPR